MCQGPSELPSIGWHSRSGGCSARRPAKRTDALVADGSLASTLYSIVYLLVNKSDLFESSEGAGGKQDRVAGADAGDTDGLPGPDRLLHSRSMLGSPRETG